MKSCYNDHLNSYHCSDLLILVRSHVNQRFIKNLVCAIGMLLAFCSMSCQEADLHDDESLHFVEFIIDTDHRDYADIVDHSFPESFHLATLTYESDVALQEVEFRYLMGMPEETDVTAAQLTQGLSYLLKKRQFESITVSARQGTDGYHMHLQIKGGWILYKLVLHGILLGKDRYRQYYTIEPGEIFDTAVHQRSVQKIKEAFAQDGYFNARVEGRLDYDNEAKAITVHIWLGHNKQSTIQEVALDIRGETYAAPQEQQFLLTKIKKQFIQKLDKAAYSKKLINEQCAELKRYLAREGYINVDIELAEKIEREQNAVKLTITIHLHKKRIFVFTGNSFFTHDQLLESTLVFGRSSCLLPASFLSEELIKIYKNKGFWDIAVQTREETQRSFFIIQEGQRARITGIEFQGVTHTTQIDLIKRYFADILKTGWYDDDAIKNALDDLVNWYIKEGFLECRITKRDYVPDGEHAYRLVITVEQGIRSYFKEVVIEGYPGLRDAGPFKIFATQKNPIPFNMEIVQQQRTWLLNHFRTQGYLYIDLTPDITRDGDAVTLHWRVDTGAQEAVRFGNIVVQGAGDFPFNYIVRELQFKEGELWDKQKIKKSVDRLKKLNVFESVHMQPYDVITHELQKPVMVKVQRDERFELRTRAGFAMQQVSKQFSFYKMTYRAGGSFWIKNPFNCGDKLGLDVDASFAERKLVAEYNRPWLGSMPIDTVVQVYSNQFQQPGHAGNSKNLYQVVQTGTLFGLRKEHEHIFGGGNIGFEWMKTTVSDRELFADRVARAINFEPQLLDRRIPYFTFEPSVTIDYVDNRLTPRKGVFILYSLKGMFPVGKLGIQGYFVRMLLEQSFYIPLDPIVFAFRLRLGHIFHKDFSSIMPSERFYLGGANSIRGYERDLAPPLGVFHDPERGPQYVPQGGKSMFNMILEMRFPIYKNFGLALFEDIGVLSSNAFRDIVERGVLSATGFGLRYETPLGPLRFDLGWRWKATDPVQPSYAWFLSLGQAF